MKTYLIRTFHLFFKETIMILLAFIVFYSSFKDGVENQNSLMFLISFFFLIYIYLVSYDLGRKYRQNRKEKIVMSSFEMNSNYRMLALTGFAIFLLLLINFNILPVIFLGFSQMSLLWQSTYLSLMLLFFFGIQPYLDKFLRREK